MRTNARVRRLIAIVLLAWFLPACSSFQTTDLAPQEAVENQEQVILTVADSTGEHIIRLSDPWVTPDSIGGVPCDEYFDCSAGATRSVPLSSIQRLEIKRFDGTATAWAVGVVVVAAGAVFVVAMARSWNERWGSR